jgi:hypothetical protein
VVNALAVQCPNVWFNVRALQGPQFLSPSAP